MAKRNTDPGFGPSEEKDDFEARKLAEAKEYQEGFDEAFKGFDWATVQPSQVELDWHRPRPADGTSRAGQAKESGRQNGPTNDVEEPAPKEFLSVREAAEIVGLSEKALRRAIRDGELPASKPRGRIRIRRADIEAWIKSSRIEPSVHDIEPWR